jgi:hypothetical protein
MPWLRQCFSIQQVLLVEIDLREVLMPHLDLHSAGRAGGISSTVVVQPESHFFGGLEKGNVLFHVPASPV